MYGDLVMDSVPEKVRNFKSKSSMMSWLALRMYRTVTWRARELDQIANITCLVMGYNLFEAVAPRRGRMAQDIVSWPFNKFGLTAQSKHTNRKGSCLCSSVQYLLCMTCEELKRFWTKSKWWENVIVQCVIIKGFQGRNVFFSVTCGRKLNWQGRFGN